MRKKSERSGRTSHHRSTPQLLAPTCRSASGSNMAITPWLHYADQLLAPVCRSRDGSYVPVGDTAKTRYDSVGR